MWTFAEIRELQQQLRAVKTCRACRRTLPIQAYYLPNDHEYKGQKCCRECCRSMKRLGWRVRKK